MSNKFAEALRKPEKSTATESLRAETTSESPHARPSRKGVKHVGGYFAPLVSKQLRQIALDEDSSVQELLAEAIDMLFESRHRPAIARNPGVVHS